MSETISLEAFIARLNSKAFWQEFTFARNKFSPQPGKELELADNFVWLGDFAFALQLKQRTKASSDPGRERNWFKSKVLTNGTRQIRDTLHFLKSHDRIQITNERGHNFDIYGGTLSDVTKIIVYFGSKALPEDCWQTRHHTSSTAGFIHVIAAHDYLGIIETLRVPKDIRDYFNYRQEVVQQLGDKIAAEPDIMGSFVTSEPRPTPDSRKHLRRFVQDLQAFDLSFLIGRLHDHIQNGDGSQDYYQIMLEFARVPRSVWREVRTRFDLCLQAAKNAEFVAPFRFAFPGSNCTFMIAALDPKLQSAGVDGQRIRINGLQMLTYGAMYDMHMERSVGILISKDGEFYQIDWCRLNLPHAPDPEIEAWLAKYNPFRPARERTINSFVFKADQL